jgi:hypothetical protein
VNRIEILHHMIKQHSIAKSWLTMMRGELLAHANAIHRRGIEFGHAPERGGYETDLHHMGAAAGTGGQVQADADRCQGR